MSSHHRLTGLSYVVLTLIGRNGASAHDLVQMARRGQRLYWAGAASKMYAEPKRLEQLGYLRSRKEPGKTRERTYYTLTQNGYAALDEWLMRPSPFPKIQSEAAIRIQASDLATDLDKVSVSIAAMRAEIDEQLRLLRKARTAPRTSLTDNSSSDFFVRSVAASYKPTSTGSTRWSKTSPTQAGPTPVASPTADNANNEAIEPTTVPSAP